MCKVISIVNQKGGCSKTTSAVNIGIGLANAGKKVVLIDADAQGSLTVSLPMKREGSKSHLKSKIPTMKFICPKMKWEYNKTDKTKRRVCHCDNPCTTSSCGRMIYVYPEKNLRAYPGVERGSAEWEETYKIRVNVENSINHFKDSFCVANRKTQNEKTLHADLLLAGIAQLVTVIVADKIHQHQYIRSLKPLIA